jgi:hypothetical protein
MQHFYDGQIRRYITQTIRVLSNFVVKYGDGTLHQVPVMYGDADRAVASIIRQNSENVVNSVPRISVYVSGLDLDRERLSDQTYVGKLHFRERGVDSTGAYNNAQGRNYTVERLMPTPFKLTMKCDIWSSSTDQKLQIMEQILVLFNPSLELQTTDNYIDWTSLSVLNLDAINWSSRQVPVGADTPIEVGTLTFTSPIWISPPVKVKHLGVITKIINNIYNTTSSYPPGYEQGLGIDPALQTNGANASFNELLASDAVTITGYKIQVYNGQAILLNPNDGFDPINDWTSIPEPTGAPQNWQQLFDQYPGSYTAGSSQLFLLQPNGSYIVGTIAVNPIDPTLLQVNWNPDTLVSNTGIDSSGLLDTDLSYNGGGSYRARSPGTFDAIIDPQKVYPGHGMQNVVPGDRFLIIEDIGSHDNDVNLKTSSSGDDEYNLGPAGWKNQDLTDFIAKANDIIEWTGTRWNVVFNAAHEADTMVWQTNIYTGIQYLWNGVSWVKSFEGEYTAAQWKIIL